MKKNLLFIFADQWRRSALGIYNDEPVKTPNMDSFARDSVVCTDSISACPLCSPARASLLSGLFPLKTGIFTNCKNGSDIHLKETDICIGDVLKENGYQNGYIGKWHLDEPEVNYDPKPESGAVKWDAYTPVGPKRHGFDFWHVYNANDNHLHPHYWENSPKQIKVDKWSPEHETDVALDFMEKRDKTKPFCLFLSWNPPHSPYDTAPDKNKALFKDCNYIRPNVDLSRLSKTMHHTYEEVPMNEKSFRELVRNYYAAISGLDDQFKRIMDYLKENNLLDDTLVVITADHGDMLGSHTLIGKHVWFEESVGVPFIIGGAGLRHGKTGTVFSSQDVPSTLLSLMNIPVPKEWDGKDVSKDIENGTTDEDSYTFIVNCPGRDIFIKAYKEAGKNILSFGWRAIRTRRYTYVINAGYETEAKLEYYLYDNKEDPYQQHPLTGVDARNSEIGKKLEPILLNWLKEQNDTFLVHLK